MPVPGLYPPIEPYFSGKLEVGDGRDPGMAEAIVAATDRFRG